MTRDDQVISALHLRMEAANLKKRAKELDARANETLTDCMDADETDEYAVPGIGSVKRVIRTNKNLNKDALKLGVLNAGVPADKLDKIWSEATEERTSVSIRFTADKGDDA